MCGHRIRVSDSLRSSSARLVDRNALGVDGALDSRRQEADIRYHDMFIDVIDTAAKQNVKINLIKRPGNQIFRV